MPANKIKLFPLQIGGGANIYIMGFQNKEGDPHHYAYEKIKGKQAQSGKRTDLRNKTPRTPHATYWTNVHMPTLQKLYNSLYAKLQKEVAPINSQWDKAKRQGKLPKEIIAIDDIYRKKAEKIWGKMLKQAGGIPMKPNYDEN